MEKCVGSKGEIVKEKCLEIFEEENRGIKRCIYHSKKAVNEQ